MLLASPLNVGVPLVVYPVALSNGGVWWVVCCPVFGLGLPLHVALSPLALPCPPSPLCVCCHGIVGLGSCLCDGVMSLWNSGDGLGGTEGRVVSTVYTSSACGVHLRGVCVVMAVCGGWCMSCLVVMWVMEWRCVCVSLFVFLFSVFLFSSLCWCSG